MNLAGLILIVAAALIFLMFSRAALKSATSEIERSQAIRTLVIYLAWIAIVSGVGFSGVISDFSKMPPKFAFFIMANFITAIAFAFSGTATRIIERIPIAWIVGFHGMRVLAELAIWIASDKGIAPVQISFHGYNFDIITGVLSLALIPILLKNPAKAIVGIWSVIGLGLLITVVTIGMLSMPTPLRMFMNSPDNTWITHMPYILLVGSLVHGALAGHIIALRWLWRK